MKKISRCLVVSCFSFLPFSVFAETPANFPQVLNKTYHEARKIIIESGWKPLDGHYGVEFPMEVDYYRDYYRELGYDEISECGGSGPFCLFWFEGSDGEMVRVVAAGEEGWSEDGTKYYSIVTDVTKVSAPEVEAFNTRKSAGATEFLAIEERDLPPEPKEIDAGVEYSLDYISKSYAKCIKTSLLAAHGCARAERDELQSTLDDQLISVLYTFMTVPRAEERINRSQEEWSSYVQDKCESRDSRLTDLCTAQLLHYRAEYLHLLAKYSSPRPPLLDGLDEYERNNRFVASWIDSFIPAVTLEEMVADGRVSAENMVVAPETSQELLHNALAMQDTTDPACIQLLEDSFSKGNLYAGVVLFLSHLASSDLERVKQAGGVLDQIEQKHDIVFMGDELRSRIPPRLKAVAKAHGVSAYRELMRELLAEGDEPQRIAVLIDKNLRGGSMCEQFAVMIYNMADSSHPENIKMLYIENILESIEEVRCSRF